MNLSLTNECNRRCNYCFQKNWYLADNKEDIKEMSLDTVERILDMMGEEEKVIKILGGEPLLYSKLEDFFELCIKKNKNVSVISNISIEHEKLKYILEKYYGTENSVIQGWLINCDFSSSQESLFLKNFSLFSKYTKFSLSTTLYPESKQIMKSAKRITKVLSILDNADDISIRISPMAPNHIDNGFYDYSLDILNFIQYVWDTKIVSIEFDCPINACEIHPEVMKFFDTHSNIIKYKTNRCSGCGAFDILVDNSVIYCSSTYNIIRLKNIFDYDSIAEAERAMSKEWKKYWDNTSLHCSYKTCDKFNPARCVGLCPAKNNLLEKIII